MFCDRIKIAVVNHYYWFVVAIAAGLMFDVRDFSSALIAVVAALSILNFRNFRFCVFDFFVVAFVFYSFSVGLFNTSSSRLLYLGIRAEIFPICFYFFARNDDFESDDFFFSMKKPILFAMLCGMFFYFLNPSFYLNYKANVLWNSMDIDISEASGHLLYEVSRLSSFWPHSYFIGYASLFILILSTKKIIIDNACTKFDLTCLLVSFFCLFFAQQRVSIAFSLLYLVVLTLYAIIHRLENRYILYVLWLGAIVLGVLIGVIAVTVLGSDFIEYVLNRTVNYEGNVMADRVGLFEQFIENLSLFGDGLGQYGHGAVAEGLSAIPDCDYIRVPAELGFIGFAMLMFICLNSLMKGLQIFKYCFFEVVCLFFALVSMIGAATWELGTLQPFLYWFCIGHVQSKFDRRDNLEVEYEKYLASLGKKSEKESEKCGEGA